MSKIVVVGANHAGTAAINTMLDNYSGNEVVVLEKGERVMQGIFYKYLRSVNSEVLQSERTGGYGSTGKN